MMGPNKFSLNFLFMAYILTSGPVLCVHACRVYVFVELQISAQSGSVVLISLSFMRDVFLAL